MFDPLRIMTIDTEINQMNLIKLKSFCALKEIIKKTKRQPTKWEKIFANDATDKELDFQNIETTQLIQHNNNRKSNKEKMGRTLNRHF